ncbi:hypothetical protein PRIPAC_77386, partial [Pristionchus pacificus]|uniref:Uncharacterized protein n=1 Tax=Pristionchus pacificus TaxID=54126 RepID=A0A8R1Z439_PRIPA
LVYHVILHRSVELRLLMLSLNEVRQWTGVTPFQWLLHSIGTLIASILLALKLSLLPRISYILVFTPCFIATSFDFYFIFVVIVRGLMTDKEQTRLPGLISVFGTARVAMLSFFQFLFYHKIEGEYEHNSISSGYSWTVVFLPIWILICGLGIQACRMVIKEDAVLECCACCCEADRFNSPEYHEALRQINLIDPIDPAFLEDRDAVVPILV